VGSPTLPPAAPFLPSQGSPTTQTPNVSTTSTSSWPPTETLGQLHRRFREFCKEVIHEEAKRRVVDTDNHLIRCAQQSLKVSSVTAAGDGAASLPNPGVSHCHAVVLEDQEGHKFTGRCRERDLDSAWRVLFNLALLEFYILVNKAVAADVDPVDFGSTMILAEEDANLRRLIETYIDREAALKNPRRYSHEMVRHPAGGYAVTLVDRTLKKNDEDL